MNKTAILSPDRRYRYLLTREWNQERPRVCWIMLNPSTADADFDDPTIRRCISFSDHLGYGSLEVVNLCAYRATQPRDLLDFAREGGDPVGPDNGFHCAQAVHRCATVVAAWGSCHKTLRRWADAVCKFVDGDGIQLYCLGTNGDGTPKHPLYVPHGTVFAPWRNNAQCSEKR